MSAMDHMVTNARQRGPRVAPRRAGTMRRGRRLSWAVAGTPGHPATASAAAEWVRYSALARNVRR